MGVALCEHTKAACHDANRRFNQAYRSVIMVAPRNGLWRRTIGILAAAGLLALSGATLATNQSQQRQAGRNANQNAKQQARSNKVDCRAANQKATPSAGRTSATRNRVAASKNGTSSTDGESRCDQPTGYIVDSPFIQSAIDFGVVRRDEGVQRSQEDKKARRRGPRKPRLTEKDEQKAVGG